MRITLKDLDTFDEMVLSKKPSSLSEAVSMNMMIESLQDNGVPDDVKEIEDMGQISFGHFIVLEQILGLEIDNKAKIKQMMPFILRPKNEEQLDNEDVEQERLFAEKVHELDYGSAIAAFNRFMKKRQEYLFKRYNGVIYATLNEDEDDDDEDDEHLSDGAITAREYHNKKFFWYNLVGTVCGDDIFKRADTLELRMYEVMPFLAEKRSIAIVEALEAKSRRT